MQRRPLKALGLCIAVAGLAVWANLVTERPEGDRTGVIVVPEKVSSMPAPEKPLKAGVAGMPSAAGISVPTVTAEASPERNESSPVNYADLGVLPAL
jgi:hypothetical protein